MFISFILTNEANMIPPKLKVELDVLDIFGHPGELAICRDIWMLMLVSSVNI